MKFKKTFSAVLLTFLLCSCNLDSLLSFNLHGEKEQNNIVSNKNSEFEYQKDNSNEQDSSSGVSQTSDNNEIKTNTLPYTSKGLTIESFSLNKQSFIWMAKIKVTNNTGKAIKNTSHFSYKVYDSEGVVLKSGNVYLEDLDGGESCYASFYPDASTS